MHSYIVAYISATGVIKVKEELYMETTALEKRLLEKLANGQLDGFILPDLHWKSDGEICRRMIVGGIPYYISFLENKEFGSVTFIVDQYYETDEMKLWFLKQNGQLMSDPDVIEYSKSSKR